MAAGDVAARVAGRGDPARDLQRDVRPEAVVERARHQPAVEEGNRGRGQHGGIAEAHGRERVVAVVSPDVEMEVSHLDRLLLLAPPHVPFRLDDALNPASAREDLDALSDQHLGRPAAEATEEENAVVVDVRDDQADLVNVAEEREQRRFLTGRTNPRDRASHPVDLDVGELGRGLAPDRRRLGLEAGRAGRLQQPQKQVRRRHAQERTA